ncbi:Tc toxin subunit A-related protein [Microscilla marina]|uniref:Hemopexin domain protein n=1 Tax=Microscilla marina ATCC 23134 TaxID=313606 RepID=A1ZN96_MICM2|nr:hemopexin repeat-containing protein [Microscilla marina]EAY28277.1 hemopexin domain protein [Microscilla marina ATCC 23134]
MSNENNNIPDLPDYGQIFGEFDFKEGDQARSVLSPAAYLADLLQLYEDEFEGNVLQGKRADIPEVLLDAEQTFSIIPYLDIVNELLEAKADPAGKNPYANLLKEAKFPLNLPFNLENEQFKMYLRELGISAEELHKLFATSHNADILANTYLGLSKETAGFLLGEYKDAELNKIYGDEEATAFDFKNTKAFPVATFMTITGLKPEEVRELLFQNLSTSEIAAGEASQFFVNAAANVKDDDNDDSVKAYAMLDADEAHIVWSVADANIPESWFDRANRFIRLARALGWSFTDLDLVLRTCCDNDLVGSFRRLAIIKKMQALTELPIDQVCSLFANMNTLGHGNKDKAADMPLDLFNRVYNGRWTEIDKQFFAPEGITAPVHYPIANDADPQYTKLAFPVADSLSADNAELRTRLSKALGVSENDLVFIIAKLRKEGIAPFQAEVHLENSFAALSLLHRVVALAQMLDTSAEELLMLFDVLEKDPAIRLYNNFQLFIDEGGKTTPHNCYSIIATESIAHRMWLVQTLWSLNQWMQKTGFTAEELQAIVGDRFCDLAEADAEDCPEDTPEVLGLMTQQAQKLEKAREASQKADLELLNQMYQQFKPLAFGNDLFKGGRFDERQSRMLAESLLAEPKGVLSAADSRLMFYKADQVQEIAYKALKTLGHISPLDFENLGLEDALLDKLYHQLILKGYLSPEGVLQETVLPAEANDWLVSTNLSHYRHPLFMRLHELYKDALAIVGDQDAVEVSLYLSDLLKMGVAETHAEELLSNLEFNQYLDANGAVVDPAFFAYPSNLGLFEVNVDLNAMAAEVHALLSGKMAQFTAGKLKLNKDALAEALPLLEIELDDLIENLKFNKYIDHHHVFTNKAALLATEVDDFKLALMFYPHRHQILDLLKQQITGFKQGFDTFTKTDLKPLATQLVGKLAYQGIVADHLEDGWVKEGHFSFFRDDTNATQLNAGAYFGEQGNQLIFKAIAGVLATAKKYELFAEDLMVGGLTLEEATNLYRILVDEQDIADYTITLDMLAYFANVNNALDFKVEGYDDYNKDVFFVLHAVAKEMTAAIADIVAKIKDQAMHQQTGVFTTLQDTLGVSAEVMEVICAHIFETKEALIEALMLPVLQTAGAQETLAMVPHHRRFKTAFRRVKQFAGLANKLKLNKQDTQVAFREQDLVRKFPESLALPAELGHAKFDFLLEAEGLVYMFHDTKYWIFDAQTYNLLGLPLEAPRVDLIALFCKKYGNLPINAAFADAQNNVWIVSGSDYYKKAADAAEWELQEDHVWGKLQTEFEAIENIDAAFTDRNGRTYLFAGDQYIRYSEGYAAQGAGNQRIADEGYPKKIADNWHHESAQGNLPIGFEESIDAAFAHEGKTFFLKENHYISSDDFTKKHNIRDGWGKVKSNFHDLDKVDASCTVDEKLYVFSGDEVIVYTDSLEAEGVLMREGSPVKLDALFAGLPKDFCKHGVEAAFEGFDHKVHLFSHGMHVVFAKEGDGFVLDKISETKATWGKVANAFEDGNAQVDAAFVGLDGYTYIFSGNQHYRYAGEDYAHADAEYPKANADAWDGLKTIDAAFVLDGKTYLFGKDAEDKEVYVRYSCNDYSEVDKDYPRATDDNWWNLPFALTNSFSNADAVLSGNGKTYLFAGQQFVYFDYIHRWWSEPANITDHWKDLPLGANDKIDAAFVGKDGYTYLFFAGQFARYAGSKCDRMVDGKTLRIAEYWGKVQNTLLDSGKVDAAVTLMSRETEEMTEEDKAKVIDKNNPMPEPVVTEHEHTYLFAGTQFYRYTTNSQAAPVSYDTQTVDSGYPKALTELHKEPRFKHLTIDCSQGIDAAFADRRHVYLFKGDKMHVIAEELYREYNDGTIPKPISIVTEDGAVYMGDDDNAGWLRLSAAEGKELHSEMTKPRLMLNQDIPENYRMGLDSVLQGTDGNTYLFKDSKYFDLELKREFDIADEWGRSSNKIAHCSMVDAAFVGRDGNTYMFSGNQYVTYEKDADYSKIKEAPKSIAADWGGLESVDLAFVKDGVTYLFEAPNEQGYMRYVTYSGMRYDEPDAEPYTTDMSWWGIPALYVSQGFDKVEAVLFEEEQMYLIHGNQYVRYDADKKHWHYPENISRLWRDLPEVLDPENCHNLLHIKTIFKGSDEQTYFFYEDQLSKKDYFVTLKTNGSFDGPALVKSQWGMLDNNIAQGQSLDATLVMGHLTYLFVGDQFYRYSGSSYHYLDAGYPKAIFNNLRKESGFEHLPQDFNGNIQAAFADKGSIYLFTADHKIHAVSTHTERCYSIDLLGKLRNNLQTENKVDAILTAKLYAKNDSDKSVVVAEKAVYLFSGDQYVVYSGDDLEYIDAGYPKTIVGSLAQDLGITGNLPALLHLGIDAVFSGSDQKFYFFKDEQYFVSDASDPAKVKDIWVGKANNFMADDVMIDTAFIAPDGYLYVLKGNEYIRYAHPDNELMADDHPQFITDLWRDLPDGKPTGNNFQLGIDHAFVFEGRTYLLKGEEYVRYSKMPYHCMDENFPQPLAARWGACHADYLLTDLKAIAQMKQLSHTYQFEEQTLSSFLHKEQGYKKTPYRLLAGLFGWDVEEVKWLKRHQVFLKDHLKSSDFEEHFDLEMVLRMAAIFAVTDKLGVKPSEVYDKVWKKLYKSTEDKLGEVSQTLYEYLGALNSPQDWEKLAARLHNELNVAKRDVLVPYVIHHDDKLSNARDLYQSLLIDVEMGSCGVTSRVKEAIAATQLYFHRYFISLEAPTPENDDVDGEVREQAVKQRLKKWWEWMKNYRVWEANRKVFLYPENYIRPELRDTKTPAFGQMEDDLQQGEITEDLVLKAYKKYIDEYTTVSGLTICGGYVYDDAINEADKNLVLFGYTKSDPRVYYYRLAAFYNGDTDGALWGPWLETNLQMEADKVYPAFAFGKVFSFWTRTEKELEGASEGTVKAVGDSDDKSITSNGAADHVVKIFYSYYNLNKEWAVPQTLRLKKELLIRATPRSNADKEKATVANPVAFSNTISNVELAVEKSTKRDENDHENIIIKCSYWVGDPRLVEAVIKNSTQVLENYSIDISLDEAKKRVEHKYKAFYLTQGLDSGVEPNAGAFPINDGREVFERLMASSENFDEVASSIFLNTAKDATNNHWFSFDYKEASFLCKPSESSSDFSEQSHLLANLSNLPDGVTSVDAITRAPNGHIYLFVGNQFYQSQETDKGLEECTWSAAKNNTSRWALGHSQISRTGQVDSVWTRNNGNTHMSLGNEFITYNGDGFEVAESAPGTLANEAFKWPKYEAAFDMPDGTPNGVGYGFLGDKYKTTRDINTEKPIKDRWWKVKNNIAEDNQVDAAFVWNNKIYLVSGDQYFRYSSVANIGKADVGYPRKGTLDALLMDLGASSSEVANVQGKQIRNAVVDGSTFITVTSDGLRYEFDLTKKELERDGSRTYDVAFTFGGEDRLYIFGSPRRAAGFALNGFIYLFDNGKYLKTTTFQEEWVDYNWSSASSINSVWGNTTNNIQDGGSMDATWVTDTHLFMTSGNQYVRYTLEGNVIPDIVDPGYPKATAGNTDGLPEWSKVDAAFHKGNTTYFFNNSTQKYVTSANLSNELNIKDKWGKVPNKFLATSQKIDAAVAHDGALFLFANGQYVRYTLKGDNTVGSLTDDGYPKALSENVDGFPRQAITAAFTRDSNQADAPATPFLFYKQGATMMYAAQGAPVGKPVEGNWFNVPKGFLTGLKAGLNDSSKMYLFGDVKNAKDEKIGDYIAYEKAGEDANLPVEKLHSKYDIIRITSSTGTELNKKLFYQDGLEALLSLETQRIDETPKFSLTKPSDSTTIRLEEGEVNKERVPLEEGLDYQSANSIYYWEIFFHAPYLIAQNLNTGQKFDEAKKWYEHIFDPSEAESKGFWKFLPFQKEGINKINDLVELWGVVKPEIAKLTALVSTEELANMQTEVDALAKLAEELNGRQLPEGHWPTAETLRDKAAELETNSATPQPLKAELKKLINALNTAQTAYEKTSVGQVRQYLNDPFDPHAIAALRTPAYQKAIVMAYIDNLIDWGDMLFRQYTRESINEARMLYVLAYDLLGEKPQNMGKRILSDSKTYDDLVNDEDVYELLLDLENNADNTAPGGTGTPNDTILNPYFFVPENELFIEYWNRVEDRLYKIRHCLNILGIKQDLPLFQPPIDPMALVNAVAGGGGLGAALGGMSAAIPHYRFTYMLSKARELTGKVTQFGNDLLGTIEKKDAEELSILQNKQEGLILDLNTQIKEKQIADAIENIKNLEESKRSAEQQKKHHEDLKKNGMLSSEASQIRMMSVSAGIQTAGALSHIVSGLSYIVPQVTAGPFSFGVTTGGRNIGAMLEKFGDAISASAEPLSTLGEIFGMQAQFERMEQDWDLQVLMSTSEIKQLEHQIASAQLQKEIAERELEIHQKDIKNNEDVAQFMKDKFSNEQLYGWMAGKLSGMFYQTYKHAHDYAKQAERAFQFETGSKMVDVNFVRGMYWDSTRKGLLSGEKLDLDLDRMEKAYIEQDSRSLEITKNISLLKLDPLAFLQLKNKGMCEFRLNESLFDYDFPGHYNRQIKTISLAFDIGEGQTINATLTQLNNKVVMEPDAKAVKYLLNPVEEQPSSIRTDWKVNQQVALSYVDEYTENNGMFEMNFADERYLPFEGTGAVSSWRLELGGKQGDYNLNDLLDVTVKLRYTADQGGENFAAAVKGALKPYETASFFDLAYNFPDQWNELMLGDGKEMTLNIRRDMFPAMASARIMGILVRYQYEGDKTATFSLNDAYNLGNNKYVDAAGLSIAKNGTAWKFTVKGDKTAIKNAEMVVVYKAKV